MLCVSVQCAVTAVAWFLLMAVRRATKAESSGLGVSGRDPKDGSLHLCSMGWHAYLMSGVFHMNMEVP